MLCQRVFTVRGHLIRCLCAIAVIAFISSAVLSEPLEDPCTVAGADDWPCWSHDYQHTGASTISVGDPNGITLQWSQPLPDISDFTNPTVANGVVYISSDAQLSGFDLTTGLPILGSPFTGIPEMGTDNRGNTTIHNGIAYVTGGNFQALSALPADDLRKASMIWSNNAMTMPGIANRFNTLIIIDDIDTAGTDLLLIGEELISPGLEGSLYALKAAKGIRYSGWPTNPISLDRAVRHSPAYDGTNLYVGTADADLTDGSIYAIDARTGTIKWQFRDDTYGPLHPGGFPGGVSIEGDHLYAASCDAAGNGRRFKIDISGSMPVVVWMHPQSRALYGAPTIGRDYIYIPQDNTPGVLVVDKETGDLVHNFAANGVGKVSQNVALSCDNYLFVGDRNARWWVLDANTFETEFYRQYPYAPGTMVNGTALATDTAGNHYAVVGIRTDGTSGRVSAYRLNSGPRPRLQQNVFGTSIQVPLESGSGLTHSMPDVFASIGNQDLTFESVVIADPNPDPVLKLDPAARAQSDTDHWTHLPQDRITKDMRLAGIAGPMTPDGEFLQSEYDRFIQPLEEAQTTSGRARIHTAATATALTRTSNVTIGGSALPVTLLPGATADLAWAYDGTDLGRGIDVEVIRLTVNDPDFDYTVGSSVTEFRITYVGGCPRQGATLPWYAGSESVFNDGSLGETGDPDNLVWNNDPFDPYGRIIYDGSFFVAADSPAVSMTLHVFGSSRVGFVSNPAPISGDCGFDEYTDVELGAYRTGGIPGTPVDITGNVIVTSYSDTDFYEAPGTPLAAIGVDVIQTEVGANAPLYGDFKLIRWEFHERNGNALTDVYAGTFIDWDAPQWYGSNLAALWPNTVNGYAIWDEVSPGNAYGMLDPTQFSLYSGADASVNPLHGTCSIDHNCRACPPVSDDLVWHALVSMAATMTNDGQGDRAVIMTNAPVDIPPYGTAAVHQALYAMPALNGSIDEALMEAQAMSIAARAARWSGFARGDVNDDGYVDLGDILWLVLGYPIYPDDYCGDVNIDGVVDQDDISRLMAWVSGDLTAQPQGAWRFEF